MCALAAFSADLNRLFERPASIARLSACNPNDPVVLFRGLKTPRDLSLPQRIWLGRKIAKVGRGAFVTSLKQRLSTPAQSSQNKPFTFADVFSDAENLRNRIARPHPSLKTLPMRCYFLGLLRGNSIES
jgi:hypothetical protein